MATAKKPTSTRSTTARAASSRTTSTRSTAAARQSKAATERRRLSRNRYSTTSSKVLREAVVGLTAAAVGMGESGSSDTGKAHTNVSRTWQHAIIGYCRTVPELNAGKMYVGNCLARIRLKVGKRNPDGTVDVIPDGVLEVDADTGKPKETLPSGVEMETYKLAAQIVSELRSPIGGQAELLRSYGEKIFSVGESFMLPVDTAAGLAFEVLSTEELRKDGSRWIIENGPGYDSEQVPDGVEPLRIWRPDDVYRKQATSSIRACLEILEELVVLTRLVRSSAISRMALAGILAISEDFDDPIDESAESGSEEGNPLLVDIITNGAKAIDDPASAASWLPYLLSGPTELIDKGIKFIEFKHDDAVNVVKRREALERLAQGVDLPFEVILGHQGTTFANATVISEDTFRVHLEPSVQLFCESVTSGILWPALAKRIGIKSESIKEAGYPDEILSVGVTFDSSGLVSRPDKFKEIVETFLNDKSQLAVAISEARGALGLDPDGGPDADEVARRLDAVRLSQIRTTIRTDATNPEETMGPESPGESEIGKTITSTISGQMAVESSGVSASLYLADGLAHKIAGAAGLAVERAASAVGAKLRPKLKGEQAATIAGLPNWELSRVLGPSTVAKLLNGDDPTAAEVQTFERTVARWAEQAGQPNPGVLAKALGQVLESTIVDRLYSGAGDVDVELISSATVLASVGT